MTLDGGPRRHKCHEQTDWRNGSLFIRKGNEGLTSLPDFIQIGIRIVGRMNEHRMTIAAEFAPNVSMRWRIN